MKKIFKHKKCGGKVEFDSFGNFKCGKCGYIGKSNGVKLELNFPEKLYSK